MPPSINSIQLVTRGSALARAQAEMVRAHIEARLHGARCEVVVMTTTGDRQTQWTLAEHGGKGLFTKELEDALLGGTADVAVHSAKDLPTELPEGLAIAGFLPRGDPRDVLVRRAERHSPALIASGSPRRREMGAKIWPEAQWTEVRGNVETRLRKIAEGQADATILAAAGLARLGITSFNGLIFEPVSVEQMVPAAGQAAIAIECRKADLPKYSKLFDAKTTLAVEIERTVLSLLGGGCHSATAAHYDGTTLRLHLVGGGIWTTPLSVATMDEARELLPSLVEQARQAKA